MNASVCFMFLLAIGLSTQHSFEFETDFKGMVTETTMPNNKTLLNCPENCDDIKEAACKCVHFSECLTRNVHDCIQAGLRRLKISCIHQKQSTCKVLKRLKNPNNTRRTAEMEREKWRNPQSPKVFLKYIEETLQMSTALG